eukprot:TRINITY_DN8408_c0_g1_i1.p1 TRINITY_DN8408_c0_g1~~TRINITY_DN8408_c0_g1_i1.p1  ORF type:complete len:326 (+),score=34.45 TRINITY_DN8408_c0_g1_i1:131-1108(+)
MFKKHFGSVSLLQENGLKQLEAFSPKQLEASWNARGTWLFQSALGKVSSTFGFRHCSNIEGCGVESLHVILLLTFLIVTLLLIILAFAFFREDKEEQITPLCPQLVLRESDLHFKMPFDSKDDNFPVTYLDGGILVKVASDWPDPFRSGTCGVSATVRMQNKDDVTLATVVARNLAMVGQGLALCRAGCDSFGYVEPDGPQMYHVRHRTGVHLLTLMGNFGGPSGGPCDIDGVNPVGSKVCSLKKEPEGGLCSGWILQHFDAGLVISSLLAVHVHRRLTASTLSPQTAIGGASDQPSTNLAFTDAATQEDTGVTPQTAGESKFKA